ncbi:cupin domain-containing protein [Brucella sp. LJL56]
MNICGGFLAAALIVITTDTPTMAADHAWKVYVNARFGYSICYPADLLTVQFRSDNGDGAVFSSKSGAELRVWGRYNVLEQGMNTIIAGLAGENAVVSYRHSTENWAVVSGKKNSAVFYAEVLLEHNTAHNIDTVRIFRLTYPTGGAKIYDAVAERLAKCFRPTGKGIDDGLQPSPFQSLQ